MESITSPKSFLILIAVFMYIALGFYIFYELVSVVCMKGAICIIEKQAHSSYTQSVSAEIADYGSDSNTRYLNHRIRHGISYSATYEYEYNGKKYSVKNNSSTAKAIYKTGDKTEIFIDPSAPEKIYDPKTYALPVKGTIIRVGSAIAYLIILVFLISLAVRKVKKSKTDETIQSTEY